MSKRKRGTGSKQPAGPRTAQAHRATQAIVRSAKVSVLRSDAAAATEAPRERHDDSKRESPLVSKQEAPLVESPPTAPQDDRKQATSDNELMKGFVFPSATANVRAYQAKLLGMAQADMQFAFEFAEKLAAIRSPIEIPRVIAEFTGKRITMVMDRVAALSTGRKTA